MRKIEKFALAVQDRTLATDCDSSLQFATIFDISKALRQMTTDCDNSGKTHLWAEAANTGSGT